MGADPDFFITKKLSKTEQGLSFFGKEALAEYMRCFRNPATIHAMCEDYRATAGVDLAMDTVDFAAGRKIETPLLLLWGATGAVGRIHKPAEIWKDYADIRGAAALPCGHYRRRKPRRRPIARARILPRDSGARTPRVLCDTSPEAE